MIMDGSVGKCLLNCTPSPLAVLVRARLRAGALPPRAAAGVRLVGRGRLVLPRHFVTFNNFLRSFLFTAWNVFPSAARGFPPEAGGMVDESRYAIVVSFAFLLRMLHSLSRTGARSPCPHSRVFELLPRVARMTREGH